MQFIAQLLEAALSELAEKGVIDWWPDDGAPDSFEAIADIRYHRGERGVSTVILCGWYIFIWREEGRLRAYHAFSTTFKPCSKCQTPEPENQLQDGVCDSCIWQAQKQMR